MSGEDAGGSAFRNFNIMEQLATRSSFLCARWCICLFLWCFRISAAGIALARFAWLVADWLAGYRGSLCVIVLSLWWCISLTGVKNNSASLASEAEKVGVVRVCVRPAVELRFCNSAASRPIVK